MTAHCTPRNSGTEKIRFTSMNLFQGGSLDAAQRFPQSGNDRRPVNERRWLVVRDACSRATAFEAFAPGADLCGALELSKRVGPLRAGWLIPRHHVAPFFCQRDNERFVPGCRVL